MTTIQFGHYEQDNDTTNGKEPITWRILKKTENRYLIVSEKVLDVKPYNTSNSSITWAKSTIRSWLNGYRASYNTVSKDYTTDNFIDTAFTAEEKKQIVTHDVPPGDNPNYSTSPGNATSDKIFLLSIAEANNYYFTDSASRKADATRYAVKQGARVKGSESNKETNDGTCIDPHCYARWWLRSPGMEVNVAAFVYVDGEIIDAGYKVDAELIGVRPAMWVQF